MQLQFIVFIKLPINSFKNFFHSKINHTTNKSHIDHSNSLNSFKRTNLIVLSYHGKLINIPQRIFITLLTKESKSI